MQTNFKRHQKVKILIVPDKEYVEYSPEHENDRIKAGMNGIVNLLLPNGQYHIEILNEKGEVIAYAMLDEDSLEAVE